jgi:hypothetical protein
MHICFQFEKSLGYIACTIGTIRDDFYYFPLLENEI